MSAGGCSEDYRQERKPHRIALATGNFRVNSNKRKPIKEPEQQGSWEWTATEESPTKSLRWVEQTEGNPSKNLSNREVESEQQRKEILLIAWATRRKIVKEPDQNINLVIAYNSKSPAPCTAEYFDYVCWGESYWPTQRSLIFYLI